MTPEEQTKIKENLRQVAEILYKNTSSAELTSFETIELSITEHLQETVAPEISNFLIARQEAIPLEEKEQFLPCVGKIKLSSKQAIKLGLKKGTRLSPHMENGNWQKDEIIRYKHLIINNLDSICPKATRI